MQAFFDNNGDPLAGGLVFTYFSGTSTKQTTYNGADSSTASANANPVVLDSAGRAAIWLPPGTTFKIVVSPSTDTDPPTNPIKTIDGVSSLAPYGTSTDVSGTAGENLTVRDLAYLSDGTGSLTAGRWYKVDRDLAYQGSLPVAIGIVMTTATTGNATTIRTDGQVTGFSGLSIGATYYTSATAGAISSTGYRRVAVADSATSIILIPSPAIPFNVDIVGTANVSFAAGDCVHLLQSGTGAWGLAKNDLGPTGYTTKILGFAAEAIISGQTGPIRTRGKVTGLSGLTAGSAYYLSSAVGGQITATIPANPRLVGIADSTTSLVICPSVPLQAFSNSTAVGNVGAGADDLIVTPVLLANSLNYDNQTVIAEFFGRFANNGNAKTLQIYFGSAKVLDTGSVVYTALGWSARMIVIRTGSSTQKISCTAWINGLGALNGSTTSGTENLTNDVIIKCVGTSAAAATDDVIQDGFFFNIFGSPTGA